METMYPKMLDYQNNERISLQSFLFGHRIKPQQTLYEYLIEFLIVAMSEKTIAGQQTNEMFPVSEQLIGSQIDYMPVSNMGLKRFIFFENSRIDTRADIDKQAYQKCCELIAEHISVEDSSFRKEDCMFILQNVLYGFSVENAGRSWFVKNLLPVCTEVLFPEALGVQKMRQSVSKDLEENPNYDIDKKFEYNSYTYMCRGGEVYYLHILHAMNAFPERKERIEHNLKRLMNSMPELSCISRFIQNTWIQEMDFADVAKQKKNKITKHLGAIPKYFEKRDEFVIAELDLFLSCKMQPMEKLDIFSYGQILQILRIMYTSAQEYGDTAWILDMSESTQREQAEIRKLCTASFVKNEESIINYLRANLDWYCEMKQITETEKREKTYQDAEKDSYKLFRKLAKNIGILIPITGSNMRFTLSEEIIKFLVMALIPAGSKVTFDWFLDMMYRHFDMIITPEHYHQAAKEEKIHLAEDVTFLNANKTAFAQKLKNCGFLRDLSDATAIVENPYEMERLD